jgi:uncharacterized protein YciI
MLFVIRNLDRPNAGALRAEKRAAHLAYLDRIAPVLKLAGPFLADDGETMIGSLWIVEAGDKAAALKLAAADPYAEAGLFESQTATPFRRARGVELG